MWSGVLPAERGVIQLAVDNLANCSMSAAASAASASQQSSFDAQMLGVKHFKQAISIVCWVLGLPG